VQNLDYASTFLDMAGVSIPDDMQGKSLVPLMKGNTPDDWRQSIYYHYYEYPSVHMVPRHNGIRRNRYKLMHFYHDIDEWKLYDLQKDPGEHKNLYTDPAHAEIVKELTAELRRLQKKYGDSDELAQKILKHLARRLGTRPFRAFLHQRGVRSAVVPMIHAILECGLRPGRACDMGNQSPAPFLSRFWLGMD